MARHIKVSPPTREAYTCGVRFGRVANALPDKQLTSPLYWRSTRVETRQVQPAENLLALALQDDATRASRLTSPSYDTPAELPFGIRCRHTEILFVSY